MTTDLYARPVKPSQGHTPISGMTKYTGGVSVIPV